MAPFEAGQVNRDGNENANMKCDPKPNARRHGGNRFTLEQRWQRQLAVHYCRGNLIGQRRIALYLAQRVICSEICADARLYGKRRFDPSDVH